MEICGDDDGERERPHLLCWASAFMLLANDLDYCTIFARRKRGGVLSASAGAKESGVQRKRLKRRAWRVQVFWRKPVDLSKFADNGHRCSPKSLASYMHWRRYTDILDCPVRDAWSHPCIILYTHTEWDIFSINNRCILLPSRPKHSSGRDT